MYPAYFPRALPRDLSLNNSSALLGGRQNAPHFTSWPQPPPRQVSLWPESLREGPVPGAAGVG